MAKIRAWGVFSTPYAFMGGSEEVEKSGGFSTSAGTGDYLAGSFNDSNESKANLCIKTSMSLVFSLIFPFFLMDQISSFKGPIYAGCTNFVTLLKTGIMDMAELKNTKQELITWVQSLTDDSVLGLLNSVKLSSEGKSSDWWEELTGRDRDNILHGIKDYHEGNTMTSKEFWNGLTNG